MKPGVNQASANKIGRLIYHRNVIPCPLRTHLVQVIDELREILDGVDVVVGGRGDERDSGLRPPELGNVRRDLGAGQLATLTGLGTLGDLWEGVSVGEG